MIDSERTSRASLKRVPRPAVIDPNQRYSLAETHAALSQPQAKTFQDVKLGRLKTINDGRRRYVLGSELIRRAQSSD
jgi:hypothetical protein